MAQLVNFEVKALSPMRVIGRAIQAKMDMQQNPIPSFWSACFGDGTLQRLEALGEAVIDPSYVGLMCRWDNGDGLFTYIVGMLMKEGTAAPEGFDHQDVAACEAAVGWIKGKEPDVYQASHPLTEAEMARRALEMDGAQGWCMELYNCPRFTVPDENGDLILDYYIPCRKK